MPAHAASQTSTEGATTGRAFGVSRRRRFGLALCVLLVTMIAVHAFCYETFTVPSGSMEPTFGPGDRILVDKMADVPRRGQVVVFFGAGSMEPAAQSSGVRGVVDSGMAWLGFRVGETDYLKRIVGVPGDRVAVGHDARLVVNGHVVQEPYLPPATSASNVPFSVTVPTGKVFVLGDNRAHSNDSRNHLGEAGGGFVPVEKIVGVVSARYWHG